MPEDASYKHAHAQCSAISEIWGSEQGFCSRKSMHVSACVQATTKLRAPCLLAVVFGVLPTFAPISDLILYCCFLLCYYVVIAA